MKLQKAEVVDKTALSPSKSKGPADFKVKDIIVKAEEKSPEKSFSMKRFGPKPSDLETQAQLGYIYRGGWQKPQKKTF